MALDLGLARWLACIAVGAALGVDASSWLQVMISRPIVSGTLGGALLGSAEAGFAAGALLEIFFLRHVPLGGAVSPDPGPAGLIGGAAYAAAGGSGLPALTAAVVMGWVVGWLGFRLVHLTRVLNGRLAGDPATLARSPGVLERRHRWAIQLDAFRAALITAALLVPAILVTRLVAGTAGPRVVWLPAAFLAAAVACSAGAATRSLGARLRWWPLLLPGPLLVYVLWT